VLRTPATYDREKLQLIRDMCAKGATDNEFLVMMELANRYQLDPFARQIWLVKYGDSPAQIFCGRDGYLAIAHRSGVFDGMDAGADKDAEGQLYGWCKVWRKDMSHPFEVRVYASEYSTGKNLWKDKPRTMIQKVAEAQCLRRAFSISGLYSPEEFDTGDRPEPRYVSEVPPATPTACEVCGDPGAGGDPGEDQAAHRPGALHRAFQRVVERAEGGDRMTSFKSVSWSALVNVGNNESLALTVSGEAANPDEARDIFAFAIGQLIGVANSADEVTAPLIRAYVSRLVQTEEARPVEQDAPAPVPKKEPWAPKITKASYDARQANAAAKQDTVPATPPSAEEQAAAAVAQCIKPPATAPEPAPSAPPTSEGLAPAATVTAPPEGFSLCAECGEAVPANQAKLSQLFQGKTLCKSCMDVK
jgi:phage recombination protein Bet